MISCLYSLDTGIFRWINGGWSDPVLDKVFIFFTEPKFFFPLIGAFLAGLFLKGGRNGRFLILALLLSVGLGDSTSNGLKHLVKRQRPCVALPNVLTPYGPKASYSFPSNHAVNIAGLALVLGLAYRRFAWFFAAWALMVGLSRVYLGVHYPSDVLGGYAWGLLAGWAAWTLSKKCREVWESKHPPERHS